MSPRLGVIFTVFGRNEKSRTVIARLTGIENFAGSMDSNSCRTVRMKLVFTTEVMESTLL